MTHPRPPEPPRLTFKARVAMALAKEWERYTGPRGGKGWRNTETGEVVYQPDKPGTRGEASEETGSGESGDGAGSESPRVSRAPDPDVDLPRLSESEAVSTKLQETNETPDWGFTLYRNLEPAPLETEDVWIVAATSHNYSREEGLSKDAIKRMYEEYLEALESEPALHIGGYNFPEDTDKMSIDISVALTDREEAIELGKKLNQKSVVNVKKGLESDWEEGYEYTGGDGEPVVNSPQELKSVISNIESLAKALSRALMAIFNKEESDMNADPNALYVSADGRVVTAMQIGYGLMHGADLEHHGDGRLTYRGVEYVRKTD